MRRLTPDMTRAEVLALAHQEGGDLRARFLLIRNAEHLYDIGAFEVSATLIHAEEYLKDRDAYIAAPWPKGCIPVPVATS